jgi:hypothetical protein
MLNEAFQITTALERSGVVAESLSPLLRKNQKKLGLRIFIDRAGELKSMNTLDAESIGALGRYEKANGMTFPAVNIGELRTLSPVATETLKKSIKGKRSGPDILAALQAAYAVSSRGWTERNVADFQKCLRDVPAETAPYWADAPSPHSGIALLIAAFAKKQWGGADFLDAFEALLLRTLNTASPDPDLLKCAYATLFEKGCPVLWEAADLPMGDHPVCSQATRRFLNRRLVERNAKKTGAFRTEALTGLSVFPTDSYPKVSLPVVGPSYFFSSPKENYCQTRYGLSEGAIFPTSQDTADKLNSAVSWLVAPEREGLTWDRLPHDGGGDPCLLIAYVAQHPAHTARVARLFGTTSDPLQSADRFENQCKAVLDLLDAGVSQGSGARIELLVIAKPDPGRRNIVFSESFTVDAFRAASTRWNEAQLAAPPFIIELPVAKGERAAKVSSFVLHPARLLVLLNTTWVRGVAESFHVSGTRFHEIYRLFLGNDVVAGRQAAALLPRALKNWTTACHVIAQERSHGFKPTALEPKVREFARQAVSALTLLLNHIGRPASKFMNDSAYHLGRALAYANKLHEFYCKHQRNNSIPTGLLGGALIATAATQPASALARLLERLPPYENWASSTLAKGNHPEAALIGWARNGLRDSLQRIPREASAKRFTESDRAELLLGYMSDLSSAAS